MSELIKRCMNYLRLFQIKTYHYDKDEKNLEKLKEFLKDNI